MGGLELACTRPYIPKFKTVGEAEAEIFDERPTSMRIPKWEICTQFLIFFLFLLLLFFCLFSICNSEIGIYLLRQSVVEQITLSALVNTCLHPMLEVSVCVINSIKAVTYFFVNR